MKITKTLSRLIFSLCLLITISELRGQVGNNNPTGVSGTFNGNVNTAGSYDPYTGNATRTVTDMTVAGAVGEYGLSYSRTWNSRMPIWQHSYNWKIDDITFSTSSPNSKPPYYIVNFPDGRIESFGPTAATDGYWHTQHGVHERFQPWVSGPSGQSYCYLKLGDGGQVKFQVTYDILNDPPGQWQYTFSYKAVALIDPYGLVTTLDYNVDENLSQITEPAGRWIKLFYTTVSNIKVISYIQGSDGREVHYTYQTLVYRSFPYVVLTNVAYYGDSSLNATYTYNGSNIGSGTGIPILASCDDPMYPGPMKKISYTYKKATNPDGSSAVYGQILSENNAAGQAVSTLTVTGANTRTETRADGRQRTFTYDANGYLTSWTDFKGISSSRTYDSVRFIDSTTDGRGNITNFINNSFMGPVIQTQYPLTEDDTPPGTPRGTVTNTYGWSGCPDPNNRDDNNPYYLYSTTDEAGNVTKYTRDSNKRVTRIDYADTGYETFSYNPFGQVLTHQMKTGGVESFTYDGRGLGQTYRSPDNASGNPTARYQYDGLDRVSGVTDVFGSYPGEPYRTANFLYNTRGQVTVTTLPTNPVDGVRHTMVNAYNPNGDGTLLSTTDQLGHITTYTYDDYRRVRSMATPLRFAGDTTPRTTFYSYDRNQGTGDDYTHTDSNVTRVALPSTNIVKTTYDENCQQKTVTASAANGFYAGTTSYDYDNAGNVIAKRVPDEQPGEVNADKSTTSVYDERNRPMSVTNPLNHTTGFTYDAGGHKYSVTQPNGQIITYDLYDSMNRVLQQTVKQSPNHDAVTKYTYEPSGLHMTMQDPRLVEIGSTHLYTFEYDQMGRSKTLTYPPDSAGIQRTESYVYDTAGRLQVYTNRAGQMQTFSYDNLHRQIGFIWSAGSAPNATFGYDAANRVTSIINTDAALTRTYYNDNSLWSETETPTGGSANTVTYAYNADGLRGNILYPSGKSYSYDYTGRDQLKQVKDGNSPFSNHAQYGNDVNGNMITRAVGNNNVTTVASPRDALGRVTHLEHRLPGTWRTFDYVYDAMGNRTSIQRDGGAADIYGYDLAQQVTSGIDGTTQTYSYDANGNRTSMSGGGVYVTNNLNQQTTFNGLSVGYETNANVSSYAGTNTYGYDAQNRLKTTTNGGSTSTFKYDGLNRKISQTVDGVTTYNVWDGWSLIEERSSSNALLNTYVYGAGEIIERITGATSYFYYQDGVGNTSHVSDATGNLLESYKYSTFGQVTVYDSGGAIRKTGSSYDVRHLYTGQMWMPQAKLYDYRNRVYSPTLTRFLQPDPIGFAGDPSNLYRYCGNDSVNRIDPYGENGTIDSLGNNAYNFGMNIYFTGNMTTARSLANYAMGRLHGVFAPYNITTNINIRTDTIAAMGGVQNTYTLDAGYGGGYTAGLFGASQGYSHIGGGEGLSGEDLFLHEILHLLGAKDHYTGSGTNRVADPTWEENIMGGEGGSKVDARNIREIINSNGWGNIGHLDYSGYSLADAFSNTIDALNNYAAAHGPGIGVITVRSSSSVQFFVMNYGAYGGFAPGTPGYYNYMNSLNDAARLYLFFMGGGQPGEGFHPVAPDKQ
jgi:RHS repeat-associated protein